MITNRAATFYVRQKYQIVCIVLVYEHLATPNFWPHENYGKSACFIYT